MTIYIAFSLLLSIAAIIICAITEIQNRRIGRMLSNNRREIDRLISDTRRKIDREEIKRAGTDTRAYWRGSIEQH